MSKTLDQLMDKVTSIFESYEKQGTKSWNYHTATLVKSDQEKIKLRSQTNAN